MAIPITGLYAGLTIILVVVLAFRVGPYRVKSGISILDGGDAELGVRMRQHGNLVETAALTLFAMAVIELGGTSSYLLHGLGLAYLVSRMVHPFGLKADTVVHPLRALGAGLSTLVMLIAGVLAIWQFVSAV